MKGAGVSDVLSIKIEEHLRTLHHLHRGSCLMRKKYEHHLSQFYWKPVLWTRAYCLISAGGASLEILKQYIGNQKAPEEQELRRKFISSQIKDYEWRILSVNLLNISEAIKSIKRQSGLDEMKKTAEGVNAILDDIIQSIASKKDQTS